MGEDIEQRNVPWVQAEPSTSARNTTFSWVASIYHKRWHKFEAAVLVAVEPVNSVHVPPTAVLICIIDTSAETPLPWLLLLISSAVLATDVNASTHGKNSLVAIY